MTNTPAIEFCDVRFAYPGGDDALRGVSLTIMPGEKVAITGLNGSGKSTLLLHTNGLLLANSGEVRVDGLTVTRSTAPEARKKVGMVFQNSDDQLFMPTVEADIAFGPKNMGLSDDEIALRVNEALSATGIEHLRKRAPFRLSGGQKKMAAIATVLSMRPGVLVMDEPTSGLDYEARERFKEIISRLPHTLLLSTHEPDLVRELCTRVVVMKEGRIAYDGPARSFTFHNSSSWQT